MKQVILLSIFGFMLICSGCENGAKTSTEQSVENSSISQNSDTKNIASFDFSKAVSHIELFQKEVSLPCNAKKFSQYFTFEDEPHETGYLDVMLTGIYYEGKKIGTVTLQGYNIENGYDNAEIISLTLGFSTPLDKENSMDLYESIGWYTDTIPVNIDGISFDSTPEMVLQNWGIPSMESDSSEELGITYTYSSSEHESIAIKALNDSIYEISIMTPAQNSDLSQKGTIS